MNLDIILRTCSDSLLTPKDRKRICGDDRQLLIKKCFHSLVAAIRSSSHEIKLTVMDDHSDARFLEFLRYTAEGLDMDVISLEERGPNHSAYQQFKLASECDGLVYSVEDDYLHEANAIDHMVGAYLHFMRRYNSSTVIFPYDCSLRYAPGEEQPCTLHHDGIRYWRSVSKTSNTLLTHYSVIRDNWPTFERLALEYPRVLEDDTINRLYHDHQGGTGQIRVFSPIPSVAYHMGYSTPTRIATTHGRWEDLWHGIPDWQLIQGWFYDPRFYQHVVSNLGDGATIVEIGAWRGRSTCCLATLIKAHGKRIRLYSVDTWEGSDENAHKEIIKSMGSSLYDDFMLNVKMCGVDDVIQPLRMDSVAASERFGAGSVDAVIIDGAHDYQSVAADIDAWLPKIKRGGVIAGDDYSDDWPGVKRAVNERFGAKVNLHGTTWYVAL
jgi:hypothetical protein